MDASWGLFVLLLAGCASLAVLVTLVGLLFPTLIGRAGDEAEQRHGRAVLLGLLNGLLLAAIAAIMAVLGERLRVPVFSIIGGLVLVALVIGLLLGLAAMSVLLGRKLKPDLAGWPQALWGSGAWILASLAPYLGWFLFVPYLLFRGFGGVVMALSALRREGRVRSAADTGTV